MLQLTKEIGELLEDHGQITPKERSGIHKTCGIEVDRTLMMNLSLSTGQTRCKQVGVKRVGLD